jgi:hypothetical protein
MGALILRAAKDQIPPQRIGAAGLARPLPLCSEKTRPGFRHTEPRTDATGVSPTGPALGASAVREPHRQRRLLASLADSGQQTPIVVVVSPEDRQRHLVIDGYKRVAALEQLGRDTVPGLVDRRTLARLSGLILLVDAGQPLGRASTKTTDTRFFPASFVAPTCLSHPKKPGPPCSSRRRRIPAAAR